MSPLCPHCGSVVFSQEQCDKIDPEHCMLRIGNHVAERAFKWLRIAVSIVTLIMILGGVSGIYGVYVVLRDSVMGEVARRLGEDQVLILTERNRLMSLADKAIVEADAKAFEELGQLASQNDKISAIANAEFHRVKGFYTSAYRGLKKGPLDYHDNKGNSIPDKEIPTDVLVNLAQKSPDWETRCKAVQLLGDRKEQAIPETLILICETDTHLDVRKYANESFGWITHSDRVDILECKYVREWWEQNKTDVLQKLKP